MNKEQAMNQTKDSFYEFSDAVHGGLSDLTEALESLKKEGSTIVGLDIDKELKLFKKLEKVTKKMLDESKIGHKL